MKSRRLFISMAFMMAFVLLHAQIAHALSVNSGSGTTVTIGSGSTFKVTGGTLTNESGSTIQGTGTLDVSGATFSNAGNLNPGASAGILTITGNFPQTSTGALNIELGGTSAGTSYDRLNVSGSATLSGTLNVSLINSFIPSSGNTFQIVNYASGNGSFNTLNLPVLAGGLEWNTDIIGTSSITLTVNQSDSDISVSPPSHDFGNVTMGATSTAQSFTLSNNGDVDLIIDTINLTGADSSEFRIQNDNCSGQTVAPFGSCTVEAVFSPTVEAAASASLSIPSNDPNTPTLDVSLNGTSGVADTVAPSIIITNPEDGSTPKRIFAISGTASDPSPSSGLDRVDIQVLDGSGFYLGSDGLWDTPPQWITADGTSSSWSHNTSIVNWIDGETYTVTAKAFDIAGNSSTASINFTFSSGTGGQAYTTLSLDLSSQTILQNATIDATGKLTRLPATGVDLSNYTINLIITGPDGFSTTQTTTTYNASGHYKFVGVSGFTQKGTYTIQASFEETSDLAASKSGALSMLVGSSAGYAIIVQGKISNEEGLGSHNKTANRIYNTLIKRGFTDENIYYFNYTSQTGVDATPGKADIQSAIDTWPLDKMNGSPAPLYIIMHDHGNTDTFYLDDETITPFELDLWLDTLESGLKSNALLEKRIIIYGACYSGSFISALSKPATDTDGGRVVITSAAANEESYKGPMEPDGIRSGSYFLEEFFGELERGYSIKESFKSATGKTETFTRKGGGPANTYNAYFDSAMQHPLLDDDGDGVGSNVLYESIDDGQTAKDLYLGVGVNYDTNSANNPADIIYVTDTAHLGPFTSSHLMWATANDNNEVSSVWMEIRSPSKTLSGTGGSNQLSTDYKKELMTLGATDNWEKQIDTFTESGMYEIFYFTRDTTTLEISPTKRSVVYKDETGNNPPGIFDLKSPDYGSEQKTMLIFEWESSTDPDGENVTYNLIIATDSSFIGSDVVYKKEEITTTATIVDTGAGLSDQTAYYWKVEAVDAYGLVTDSTQAWPFYTNNTNFGTGFIYGMIYDETTFTPIEGATISADEGSETVSETVSIDGGYYFLDASAGTYTVTCSYSDYSSNLTSSISVSFGGTTELNMPMTSSGTSTGPTPDIKANGSDGPLNITLNDNLLVTVELDSGDRAGENADWWVYATSPFGTYWYTLDSGWVPLNTPIRVYGGPLFSLAPYTILEMSTLPTGNYVFNFEVDNNMDNVKDGTYTDSVGVNIQ